MPDSRPDDLRKRYQTFKPLGSRLLVILRPVCHLLNPMGHANGNFPPAYRTDPAVLYCFLRAETKPAFAVPIHVILALFREKFDRPKKSFSSIQCCFQRLVGELGIQKIRLSPELRRRMSVRIRNELKPIQRGHSPVHRRIRR